MPADKDIPGRSCRKGIIFVVTNVSSWQTRVCHVCHDKTCLLFAKKQPPCHDNIFVTTFRAHFCCDKKLVLLQQTRVCHDKSKLVARKPFVATKLFVMPKICLSWQAYFCHDKHVQTGVCCNKSSVTIKTILVAAPAHDTKTHACQHLCYTSSCTTSCPINWIMHKLTRLCC